MKVCVPHNRSGAAPQEQFRQVPGASVRQSERKWSSSKRAWRSGVRSGAQQQAGGFK
jgi:hypothetical protein